MKLEKLNRVHFIGIGGIGMSGLAEYFYNKGIKVSGSDKEKSLITDRLEKTGIKISFPHSESNIEKDIDLVVYTAAVNEDNPELKKSIELNISVIKRAKLLSELVNERYLIAISGTHGKTTTTSIISKIFIDADTDPILFVGGSLSFLNNASFRAGEGKFSIAEADEYDRSFLSLKPDIIIINNIDFDHSDIYADFNEFKNGFNEFVNNLKGNGLILANSGDKNVKELLKNKKNVKWFGFNNDDDYKISEFKDTINKSSFKLNEYLFESKLHGVHNILNSAAAISASIECGLNPDIIKKSIWSFDGVKRRMELKYSKNISVIDDYAHHPQEVAPTLQAIKNISSGRVITVFQPHLYSRTRDFYKEFANSLEISDIVYLAKIYPARETPIEGITSGLIEKNIKKNITKYISDDELLLKELNNDIKNNDTVVFMGAGSISALCDKFIREYLQ